MTGSIVPRVGDGPQPVVILDQSFFQRQASQTVADVLTRLPQNSGSFTPAFNPGQSFTPGASVASLHGLGANATLTLLDSRRQVAYPLPQNGTESFVDLNSIPLAAVDRIEVLQDGGSATYGSDAIAGVVNIILKDEYQGADLNFHYGVSQRGDYEVYHASVVSGLVEKLSDTSKFSAMGAFDYYEQGPIMQTDRGYSNEERHSRFGQYYDHSEGQAGGGSFVDAATQANYYTVKSGTRGPTYTQNDFTFPDQPLAQTYGVQNYQLEPREQRFGGYVNLKYEPTQWLKLYEQISDQHNKENSEIPAIGWSQSDGLIVPAYNPHNPWGFDLIPDNKTLSEFGPDKQVVTVDTIRTVTGLTIQLPKNWFVDTSFLYAESNADEKNFNNISKSRLQLALNGQLPGFVGQFYDPFADQNTVPNPNGRLVDALRITTEFKARTSLLTWGLRAGGEVVDLPAGPVTVGLGAEYRSERLIDYIDTNSRNGNVVGGGNSTFTGGSRYIKSAFGEITIPILGGKWSWPGARLLEIVISERYDDYSDFGEAAKPKFSLRYKPFEDLTIRASYAEGFRAPSLTELFSGTILSQTALNDPKNPQLQTQTYNLHTGGNPNLKAETSYGYFAGAVWQPGINDPEHSPFRLLNGLNVYADWFQILRRNTITTLSPQQIVDAESQFPGLVHRFASNNQISYIDDPFVNLGAELVDGIDFGFSYNTKEFGWGKLELQTDASYVYKDSVKSLVSGGRYLVFQEDDRYALPDLRLVASIFYSKRLFGVDTFRTGFTLNFTDSQHDRRDNFKDTNPSATVQPNGLVHRIGSFTTIDWQVSYQLGPYEEAGSVPAPGYSKDGKKLLGKAAISPEPIAARGGIRRWFNNTTATFGVNNIADVNPPFSDTGYGYNPYIGNPFGRYFYVELDKKF